MLLPVINVYVTLSVPFFHPSILPPPFPPFIHLSAGLSLRGQDVFLSCSGDLTVKTRNLLLVMDRTWAVSVLLFLVFVIIFLL